MKLGAHGPNRRRSRPLAQIMRKSIFTAESQFSWNWVPTAQIGAEAVPSSDHEKINFYGRIAIFMKLGAHGPNRRRRRPRAQIMRKSIFTAESQFSWNWVPTAQIGAEGRPQLRSWENQFLRPNRNFHEIGCPRPKSAQKGRPQLRSWENQFLRPNRNFHEIGCPRPKSAQKPSPELRSWENQFLRPNRNFHEIGCPRPKSAQKPSPSSDHEKINFYGRIAIFMKLGAHGPNRRRRAVPELRSWENQFLRPNRNFHEIGWPRPKSAQKPSPSSDHEKINFYGRIAIFMKLGSATAQIGAEGPSPSSDHEKINFYGRIAIFMKLGAHGPNRRRRAVPQLRFHEKINFYGRIAIFMKLGGHGPNRRRSRPPAQISWENQFLRPNRNFHEIGWETAQIGAEAVPQLRSWENQFLRPNRNFHEIGCPRPKSARKPSPSSDHEKINFYGRIAIFMKLGAHGPNRRRLAVHPIQIMRKSIFTAESQFSWNWVPTAQIGAEGPSPSSDHEKINFYGRIAIFMKLGAHGPNRRRRRPRAQIMRKSIFTAESQFSHEIGWPRPKSAQKPSPSSDHEKINFYGRIAIFMKLGAHGPNRRGRAVPELRSWENQFLRPNRNFHEIGCPRPKSAQKGRPSSDHEKINFYGRIAIFMKLGGRTAQIGAEAVPELRSWENQFLRPNRNFHEIGCPRPKSAQKPFPELRFHEKINFYGRIAIFMKSGLPTAQIGADLGRGQLRFHEKMQFLRP